MKTYKNILLAQVDDIENLFNSIFSENDIKQIVEIGTNRGGLSIWLSDNAPENCQILTLDINRGFLQYNEKDYSHNLQFVEADCFHNGKDLIVSWIQKPGQTLVLCDGGHKNEEFKLFSQYLKPNDIILLHDYIDNGTIWGKTITKYDWPSPPESSRAAIENSLLVTNLEEYQYIKSCEHLWGCFKKRTN
jgi:hypothetical protein